MVRNSGVRESKAVSWRSDPIIQDFSPGGVFEQHWYPTKVELGVLTPRCMCVSVKFFRPQVSPLATEPVQAMLLGVLVGSEGERLEQIIVNQAPGRREGGQPEVPGGNGIGCRHGVAVGRSVRRSDDRRLELLRSRSPDRGGPGPRV